MILDQLKYNISNNEYYEYCEEDYPLISQCTVITQSFWKVIADIMMHERKNERYQLIEIKEIEIWL